tara:strand:- start:181 stop:2292 length:2112 start_codon:yes stop_codon:yes gene_type:complete
MVVALVSVFIAAAFGLNNGLLRTPPMGFSDACLGGGENTRLNATELQAVASSFLSSGLASLGYSSMNLDDSWELFNRSAAGALQPDPAKFPNGMKPLRDWLHDRNLTLGLYTSDAERSCKFTAGSLYHESIDAATLALDYGVDFIKVDDCGEVNLNSFAKFSALRDAFNRTGIAVAFSCEPHVTSAIGWLPHVCNQWRTTSDNCKLAVSFASIPAVLAANNVMAHNAGPGSWNDLDPVMIGAGIKGELSVPEARSLFTLFAVVKAPLLLGSDPSRMGPAYLEIVKNAEVIAVNQDALGAAAVAVAASKTMVSFKSTNTRSAAPCATKPPTHHLCCDHYQPGGCKIRDEKSCRAQPNCCYAGSEENNTRADDAGGSCWLNEAPGPSPGPSPPSQPTPDTAGGLLAFCEWGDGKVAAAQRWLVDGERVKTDDGTNRCLERVVERTTTAASNSTLLLLALRPCSAATAAQVFETKQVNETLAQIRVPPPASASASASASPPQCVGVNADGVRTILVDCAVEDPKCERERCATSVLTNQLWYWSSMTGQLMSSFTASSIPPLLRSGGWGPNNASLTNIPLCLASAPRVPARPRRIPQPPAVLPTPSSNRRGSTDEWPAQQVWAGPLSGGAFVVVLWNLDTTAAVINATWAEIDRVGSSTTNDDTAYTVRDLWKHSWLSNSTTSSGFGVSALVQSHDVVALKLTPIRK